MVMPKLLRKDAGLLGKGGDILPDSDPVSFDSSVTERKGFFFDDKAGILCLYQ